MIYNNGTFLSGERNLSSAFLIFFVLGGIIYNFLYAILIYLLLEYNPFALCQNDCSNISELTLSFNSTYYIVNLFVITTSLLILFSSYILWLNAKNTYNPYSVYSAKIFSVGMGIASFIFFLIGLWTILIPQPHLERIIPDLMFSGSDGQLSSFWTLFVKNS